MKLVSHEDCVAGWLDGSIHGFLEFVAPTSMAQYALVTCLGNDQAPALLLEKDKVLEPLRPQAQIIGNGFLVPTNLLLEADVWQQIFTGFDEVFFFPTKFIGRPKPESASLVGPGRVTQFMLDLFGKWLSDYSCSLGIGDGGGLNFVVRTHTFNKLLLGYSIQQNLGAKVWGE